MFERTGIHEDLSSLNRLHILCKRIRIHRFTKDKLRCPHKACQLAKRFICCISRESLIDCLRLSIETDFLRILRKHLIITTFYTKLLSIYLSLCRDIIKESEGSLRVLAGGRNEGHTCFKHDIRIPCCLTGSIRSGQRCK